MVTLHCVIFNVSNYLFTIKRAAGKEYDELLVEFIRAVKQNYGEKIITQVASLLENP